MNNDKHTRTSTTSQAQKNQHTTRLISVAFPVITLSMEHWPMCLSADMRVQGNHSTLNTLLVQSLPPQLPPTWSITRPGSRTSHCDVFKLYCTVMDRSWSRFNRIVLPCIHLRQYSMARWLPDFSRNWFSRDWLWWSFGLSLRLR